MRKDHFAYQRATRVAQVGFALEAAIGLSLLVCFGYFWPDTTLVFASLYVLSGLLVWLGLMIVFHQHKLERLESLETDELAGSNLRSGSAFDGSKAETQVAARRLQLMHKFMMPGISVLLAAILVILVITEWKFLRAVDATIEVPRDFLLTHELGWAVAISLFIAAVSFIFARFVAGMAKQEAWQNLRGGAAYVVGIALVMLLVATGIIFRFFENNDVNRAMAWVIIAFQFVLALEISFNFLLNLYRPRVQGEVPRPAFDSKLLSLAAAPDSLVRTINEAINYQFGFNITNSWGYRLVVRSLPWLVGIGVAALVGASMLVVVEPNQRALRLRGGAMVGAVHEPGLMVKLPWPLETAAVFDVTQIRELDLTPRHPDMPVNTWGSQQEQTPDSRDQKPFIVSAENQSKGASATELKLHATMISQVDIQGTPMEESAEPQSDDVAATQGNGDEAVIGSVAATSPEKQLSSGLASTIALVDADLVLQYRVKADGLADYLRFASDDTERRQRLTDRERAIQSLALEEVSKQFYSMPIEDVLGSGRGRVSSDLAKRIQMTLDSHKAGIEVVSVIIPFIKPHGIAANKYEELGISRTQRQQAIERARSYVMQNFVGGLGVPIVRESTAAGANGVAGTERQMTWQEAQQYWREVLAETDQWNDLQVELADLPEGSDHRAELEQKLRDLSVDLLAKMKSGQGEVGNKILEAEANRWSELLNTRGRAGRIQSEMAMFHAAPRLYKQRALMSVFADQIPLTRKYILGIDPSKLNLNVDIKELTPFLNFSESQGTEGDNKQ